MARTIGTDAQDAAERLPFARPAGRGSNRLPTLAETSYTPASMANEPTGPGTPPSKPSGGLFTVGYVLTKLVSIAVGGALTLLCLVAMLALVLDDLWIRLGIAAVASLVVPLFVADRLLPSDNVTKARGLPSEVIAFTWVAVPIVFLLVGGRPLLHAEASRLEGTSLAFAVPLAVGLAGLTPSEQVEPSPVVEQVGPDVVEVPEPSEATPEPSLPPEAGAPEAPAAPEPPTDEELSPAELFRRWSPSVVSIQLHQGTMIGGGTGFFISETEVLTNHHVIVNATVAESSLRLGVKLKDGRWATDVFLVDIDPVRDLARLRVTLGEPPASVVLGDAEAVMVGERAISIGNPLGLEHTLTDGIVSARRVYDGKRFLQTSVPLSPGNSGGPLFDSRGRVIGVSTAQVGGFGAQNLNLAVPVDDVRAFIARTPENEPKRIGGGEPTLRPGSW